MDNNYNNDSDDGTIASIPSLQRRDEDIYYENTVCDNNDADDDLNSVIIPWISILDDEDDDSEDNSDQNDFIGSSKMNRRCRCIRSLRMWGEGYSNSRDNKNRSINSKSQFSYSLSNSITYDSDSKRSVEIYFKVGHVVIEDVDDVFDGAAAPSWYPFLDDWENNFTLVMDTVDNNKNGDCSDSLGKKPKIHKDQTETSRKSQE